MKTEYYILDGKGLSPVNDTFSTLEEAWHEADKIGGSVQDDDGCEIDRIGNRLAELREDLDNND